MPAGLYIHVPFCLSKCPYCDFYSIERDDSLIDEFAEALLLEINLLARTKWKDRVYNTIFFGGGTPPLLGDRYIAEILQAIRRTFNISPRAEISLEANPESLSLELLQALKSSGVNRISIGAQSFDNSLLQTLGRIHTAETALKSIDQAGEAGFENISIDLIFGIPGQTIATWRESLKLAAGKKPAHISAYGLTIEKGTPYDKMVQKGELTLPADDVQAEMYQVLNEMLTAEGYRRYEVSNFARPGSECQHNYKYWRDDKYIGLGPSAHSYDGDSRTANHKNLEKYLASIKKGKPPVNFKEKLTDRQRAEERLLLGLRIAEGIDINLIREVLNNKALGDFQEQGYIEKKLNNIMLTDKGFLVADEIIVKLLRN